MMPSMPRLSTPARSHSSTPIVPRISGVAMRRTATQKVAVPSVSSRSGSTGQVPVGREDRIRYWTSIEATSIVSSETATMTSAM